MSISNRFFSIIGFGIILILSTSIIDSASGQQSTKVLGIKITSPVKGQQISPSGNNLTVTGIASYNSTMNCNVSVIVNNLKPYHKVLPTGKTNNNVTNDYSAWKYDLASAKGVLKTGTNKITSKLTCQKNNAEGGNSLTPVTKFYSVNITATPSTTKQQERFLKNSTSGIGTHNFTNNNNNKTGLIVKKQTALSINSTKITLVKATRISLGGAGKDKTSTANITAQTGNRSQQTTRPSQSTTSAATLLSDAGIMSSSSPSNKGNTQTSGSTNSNTDHAHEKSVLSGANTSNTKSDNHSLVDKNSVSGKQQSDNTSIESVSTAPRSLGTSNGNSGNNDLPIIASSQLSNHPALHGKASNESVRVYIPNPGQININTTIRSKTNSTTNSVNQNIGPVEKPQLPNNDDKIPFVIATPLHHVTNGSDQPVSVTLALNLVDKMRVIGYNSGDILGTSTLAPFQQQGNAFMSKEK